MKSLLSQSLSSFYSSQSRRGAALVTVLVIVVSVSFLALATLSNSSTQNNINRSHIFYHASRNTAEAMAEYGAAETMRRFLNAPSLGERDLIEVPLTPPSSAWDFFSRVDDRDYAPKAVLSSNMDSDTGSVMHGGMIYRPRRVFIDPSDPQNDFDPLKGKFSWIRDVAILGRGWVRDYRGEGQTEYTGEWKAWAMQILHLRDSPLFSNAIFYNMDIEFHNGPPMVISGPVHVNGDAWVMSSGGLNFTSGLSTSGAIKYGHPTTTVGRQKNYVSFRTRNGNDLEFFWPNGTPINGNASGSRTTNDADYLQASRSDWRQLASQRWGGAVLDSAHNVPRLNPVGFQDYEWVDRRVAGAQPKNHAYHLIQPIVPANHPDALSLDQRKEQLAWKAGLILRVEMDPTNANNRSAYRVVAERVVRDGSTGEPVVGADGTPKREEVVLPKGLIGDPNESLSAIEEDGKAEIFDWDWVDEDVRGDPSENARVRLNEDGTVARDSNGNPIPDVAQNDGLVRVWRDGRWRATTNSSGNPSAMSGNSNNSPQRIVLSGLYDRRQGVPISSSSNWRLDDANPNKADTDRGKINVIALDINRLRQLVDDTDPSNTTSTDLKVKWRTESSGGGSDFDPKTDWNGVLYVQFPTVINPDGGEFDPALRTNRDDKVAPVATKNVALKVINGSNWWQPNSQRQSTIPRPSYRPTDGIRGLTLATNAPVYLVGDFNSDGQISGSPSGAGNRAGQFLDGDTTDPNLGAPKDPGGSQSEPPAAIAADSVTVLSNNWRNATRTNKNTVFLTNRQDSANAANRRPTLTTEVSSAILTGNVPTIKGSNQISGGAHNFPRFLESWGGTTLHLRTSLVALFESEVQNRPFIEANHSQWYAPPTRNWGFNDNFRQGVYPPGTPNTRTYRRIAFTDLPSQEDYNATLTKVRAARSN